MSQVTVPARLAVLLFTDIVGSTELKTRIGSLKYWGLLQRHNELFESICPRFRCIELKHTGDGYFATFPTASDAVQCALLFQAAMRDEDWPFPFSVRVGIASGQVAEVQMAGRSDFVGLAADLASRVMSLASGGQILLTKEVYDNAWHFGAEHPDTRGGAHDTPKVKWLSHGRYFCKGCDDPIEVCEVGAEGLAPLEPPGHHRQNDSADQPEIPPWRPAPGLEVPSRKGWILKRKIGEGGFGEVWLAHQPELNSHLVFKFCFDADRLRSFKRELSLFERMRQLDRNDIARLVDVQLHQPPYFLASEYAAGGNLAEWVEQQGGLHKISLDYRLEIVAKIAEAVAAAHSQGVLHKDIKPANILIDTLPGGKIRPRISDFGIGFIFKSAELQKRLTTAGPCGETTLNHSDGSGALMYAPPEILTGRPFTMQGDVYALGVLLYQMVVADLERPLAPGWERDVHDEVVRDLIGQCVDGHLQRRLSSATSLAKRLRRLNQERRTRRTIRWLQRAAIGSGVLTVLAILLMIWGFRERALKDRERVLKDEANRQAEIAREKREVAEAVLQFHRDVLGTANAEKKGKDVTVVEVMHAAVKWMQTGVFEDKPLVGAAVRASIGDTFRSLGHLQAAETLLKDALRVRSAQFHPDHLGLAESRYQLAQLQHDWAHRLFDIGQDEQAHARLKEAEALYKESLDTYAKRLPPRHPARAPRLAALGDLYREQGRYAEAIPLLTEALEISREAASGKQHIVKCLHNLALAFEGLDEFAKAESLVREAIEIKESNESLGKCYLRLGWCLYRQNRSEEAAVAYVESNRFALAAGDLDTAARANDAIDGLRESALTASRAQTARHQQPPAPEPTTQAGSRSSAHP